MLTLAQVLTQLHVSVCASLSLRNQDMTTEAVVVTGCMLTEAVAFSLQHMLFSAKPAIHSRV